MHALPNARSAETRPMPRRLCAIVALLVAVWQPAIGAAAKPTREELKAKHAIELKAKHAIELKAKQDREREAKLAKVTAQLDALGVKWRRVNQHYTDTHNFGPLAVDLDATTANEATVAQLRHLSGICSITLDTGPKTPDQIPFTDTIFYWIAQIKDLETMGLRNISIPPKGIEKLAEAKKLIWITLTDCEGVNDETARQLAKCRTLLQLSLDTRYLTAAGYAHLASMPMLRQIEMRGATDEGIKQFAANKSIDCLVLGGTNFSDEGLRMASDIEKLEALGLTGSTVTAAGIRHLKLAGGLTHLSFDNCPQLDFDALKAVGELSELWFLSLHHLSITDADLVNLNSLVHLYYLSIEDCQVTGAGFNSLTDLGNLGQLTIQGEQVSNDLFPHLQQFPNLHMLSMGGSRSKHPRITDEGLKSIGIVPRLGGIEFRGTGITRDGLEPLRALPTLTTVHLWGTPGVKDLVWSPKDKP